MLEDREESEEEVHLLKSTEIWLLQRFQLNGTTEREGNTSYCSFQLALVCFGVGVLSAEAQVSIKPDTTSPLYK